MSKRPAMLHEVLGGLRVSTRLANALDRLDAPKTVDEAIAMGWGGVLKIHNLGRVSAEELRSAILSSRGVDIKPPSPQRRRKPHIEEVADRLVADNARLRALVKEAEYARAVIVPDYDATETRCTCPWCDSAGLPHAADCRAFTPEGEVK